ncbi:hypothetical protein VNO80_07351 [Phaseolus coccineus]|uniref:Uncharacterized protein n=1 Tax=Phaseolus coccineus TaxID=3886 RepID=A0AAN9NP12_PHACN
MAIGDDTQRHSPSILNAPICEECDTFEEDLDMKNSDCHKDPYENLQSLPLILITYSKQSKLLESRNTSQHAHVNPNHELLSKSTRTL